MALQMCLYHSSTTLSFICPEYAEMNHRQPCYLQKPTPTPQHRDCQGVCVCVCVLLPLGSAVVFVVAFLSIKGSD